jgi:hypothetical protein
MKDPVTLFKEKYNAEVNQSQRRYARMPRYDYLQSRHAVDYITHEYEYCVDVTLTKEQFHRLIEADQYTTELTRDRDYNQHIVDMLRADERVRMDNPAVSTAYKKYLMLLELARK